jgi:hypothetical protein
MCKCTHVCIISMYVCMYVCMYAFMYLCVYVCTYVRMCVCVCEGGHRRQRHISRASCAKKKKYTQFVRGVELNP